MYRTLLVVDQDLIRASKFALSAFTEDLRGKDRPSSVGRIRLENLLAEAASESPGQVIIYCPSEKMQAKEIDVRLEVKVESVLPLRELAAMGEFVDLADVEALRRHYEQLWRVYVFVSPEVFEDTTKCRAIVDRFCEEYAISRGDAYKKVRTHQFTYFQERGASLPASRTTEADSAPPASTGTNAAGLVLNGLGWDDKLLESRLNLANFVKKKKLSLSRRQVLWDGYQREYLGGDNSLIERTRRGAQSEKDWAERNQQLEREEREPELIKDE